MSTVTKETFWTQIVEDPTLYGTITTEDSLFNYRSDAVWQVMNETFIANGTNFEVTKWEELLGLTVTETTLNGRKAAILNHITENLPITIGILEQLIKEKSGEGNYIFEYNKVEDKLNLKIPSDLEQEINNCILRLIPLGTQIICDYDIPSDYFGAKFLESTGTQIINTGIILQNNFGYKLDVQCVEYKYWSVFAGCAVSSGSNYYQGSTDQLCVNYGSSHLYYPYKKSYARHEVFANYKNDSKLSFSSEGILTLKESDKSSSATDVFVFFYYKPTSESSYNAVGRLYSAELTENENITHTYVMAISPNGKPCIYDKNTKSTHYKTGTGDFIVGMTREQAKKLRKLPTSIDTLTISLPTNYTEDEEVLLSLDEARSKGWTLTIQTYDESNTSTASTFGMRRIWVRKTQDENGSYVDADGNRFQVEWCVEIYSPENKTPEDLGYEQFRSIESAVEYWELTPYVDPTLEEQFNITNEEQ